MATLIVQSITRPGLNPTYAAASSGGDKVRPGPHVFLHVKNGDTASKTVTIATPGNVNGLAIADRDVIVAAGEESMIQLPADDYADPADGGLASITYSGTTALTVAALRA